MLLGRIRRAKTLLAREVRVFWWAAFKTPPRTSKFSPSTLRSQIFHVPEILIINQEKCSQTATHFTEQEKCSQSATHYRARKVFANRNPFACFTSILTHKNELTIG
jgi:hypothetical protein